MNMVMVVEADIYQAVEYYIEAAKLGYSEAIYSLGTCFEFGEGIEQNDERAFKCYEEAAKPRS